MGIRDKINLKPFTLEDVKNKELVIKMLNYEEELTKSQYGKELYANSLNQPFISLNVEKSLNRLVLSNFDFDTSDESVNIYRTIFRTYYKSAHDYDKDVLDAVHYMRENKCVYYKNEYLKLGEKIPDCDLYELGGFNKTTLYDVISKFESEYTLLAPFSLS